MPLVELSEVCRDYSQGDTTIRALGPLSLAADSEDFVVVLGPSGSGKTTLLNLMAGLDQPTAGNLSVNGQDLATLSSQQLEAYRRDAVGLVFQSHNLLPTLTARENVELVAQLAGCLERVDRVLEEVGLPDRANHFPHELSGGEQQRVAIARALVKDPPLLLADEPTGSLDSTTGKKILELFVDIHRRGRCLFLVTHHRAIASTADRVLHLKDGQIQEDQHQADPAAVQDIVW